MSPDQMQDGLADVKARLVRVEMAMARDLSAEEGDVLEILRTLWRGKWFIAVVTAIGAAVALTVALWLPNEYRASAVLTPASTSSSSSLSRLATQFGGLAALAGVNIGAEEGSDKTVVAMELIDSWEFLERFIHENHLEVAVFAAQGWDRTNNKLIVDPRLYDAERGKWVRKSRLHGDGSPPSGWELYREFSKRVSISQDKKTGLISLSVEFYSPVHAKEWVEKLILAVNKHIQEQDRQEASRSIEYLQEKLGATTLSGMQSVFSRLIEEQTKNLMLADISDEYALKTISPSKVPEEKSKPSRGVICVLGVLLGGGLGCLSWFWYSMTRRQRLLR